MPKLTKFIRFGSAAACGLAFVALLGIDIGYLNHDLDKAVLFLLAASMSAQILLPIDRVV